MVLTKIFKETQYVGFFFTRYYFFNSNFLNCVFDNLYRVNKGKKVQGL